MELLIGLLVLALAGCIGVLIDNYREKRSLRKKNQAIARNVEHIKAELQLEKDRFTDYREAVEQYKRETEYLKKFEGIRDVEAEIMKMQENADRNIEYAEYEATRIKKEARVKAKEMQEKADMRLENARLLANELEKEAHFKAEAIAGEAWKVKGQAEHYKKTAEAMKNRIEGYGDEYLIPNQSLLDDLAEEYSHKEAGAELAEVRKLIKSLIKRSQVATSEYVDWTRRSTAIAFIVDAFNGKVDSIMSKVKHDNYGKLHQALKDAFRLVNYNGKAFEDTRIKDDYLGLVERQLKLAVTVQELKRMDREEQKAIRDAMREEERARREYEKALKEAEKEEKMLEKAMKMAESKLASAAEEQRAKYEQELEEIKAKLVLAEEKGQRALSMAQQTKQGHVYIISNVGSFGENIYKIGLTRRLIPMDRVKELGDASVPFQFDVHAMIHSDNAPQLEKQLHQVFDSNRVNKVNYRKEFFNVSLSDIKAKVDEFELNTHWTMKAEALEYRETIEIEKRGGIVVGVRSDDVS